MSRRARSFVLSSTLAGLFVACGSSNTSSSKDASGTTHDHPDASDAKHADASGIDAKSSSSRDTSTDTHHAAPAVDASMTATAGTSGASCPTEVALIDVASPATVVGTGVGTCTEAALAAAVAKGGVLTFDCGTQPATIEVTSTLVLRTDVATTLDGAGLVTLDGGNTT